MSGINASNTNFEFTYDKDEGTIECELSATISFKNSKAKMEGYGVSYKESKDKEDTELGESLALIRALKDLDNQIENWLIKLSCTETKTERKKCELKDFIGKCAVRTKPVIRASGKSDDSFTIRPIKVLYANDTMCGYKSWFLLGFGGGVFFFSEEKGNAEFLDNNWIEYKGKI